MRHILHRIPASLLALALISLAHLGYVLSQWYAIPLHNGLPVGQTDPDTWLRLTLVRDWLSGGHWFDHQVAQSNAPFGGVSSPWTRPVDMALAFFTYLQPTSVELSTRLMRASLLMPWLWMTLLVAGIHRIVRHIMPLASAYFMACVLVATTPLLWNYFSLGNADHHAPLTVLFVWAMGGLLAPVPTRKLMIFSGICFGLQLWVSVEAFLLIGVAYLWLGLQWLRGDYLKATALAWLATATAFTSMASMAIEVPISAWLTPVYDSLSIVYVYSLVVAALLAWLLQQFSTPILRGRILIGLIGTALAAAAIAALYPHLPHGPLHGVDPFILSDFLPRITEAKPFYKVEASQLAACTYLPLMVIILCLAPWLRPEHAFYSRAQSAKFVFFLGATLLLYYSQQRWSYYLLPLAIAIVAPLLGALFTPEHPRVARHWPANYLIGLSPNEQMKRRLPVLLGLILMPLFFLLTLAMPELITIKKDNLSEQRESCYQVARQIIRSGELNRVLPKPTTVLIATDLGAELLFFTPHRIIASNYHREGAGIKYVWDAQKMDNPKALRTHLNQRQVGALLICPTIDAPAASLMQQYVFKKPLPNWLHTIPYQLPPTPTAQDSSKQVAAVKPLLVKVVGK